MEKILVADDVPANRLLLTRMLERKGYAVVQAVDGREAVELYRRESPDLVLMDINMPRLDGGQATSQIKHLAGSTHVPVIFVTALREQASLVGALATGGDDFICKPVDMEVLQSKIRAHLRIRELNGQLDRSNRELRRHNAYLAHEQELAEYFFDNALRQSFLDPDYIQYHISPMSAFCGDLLLAEQGPNGSLYVLAGDFTGHGLSAAMGTLPAAQVFFRMSRKGLCVGEIVREVNRHLVTLTPVDMFFAATLLEISPGGERLSIWVGGMPDAYLVGQQGELKSVVRSSHMPLGILSDAEFDGTVEVLTPETGDRLYICSDGVLEATGNDGGIFGAERLKTLLTVSREHRFAGVVEALRAFRGGRKQEDDITLVEVACAAPPPRAEDAAESARLLATIVPLSISTTLSANDVRERDPVEPLVAMLAAQAGLARHRGLIHTVLSELYSNAVDHGLLKLNSRDKTDEEQFAAFYTDRERALQALRHGTIRIDITIDPTPEERSVTIRVSDSGEGSETSLPEHSDNELHGRGRAVVAALCERVSVSEGGRTVEAVYALR